MSFTTWVDDRLALFAKTVVDEVSAKIDSSGAQVVTEVTAGFGVAVKDVESAVEGVVGKVGETVDTSFGRFVHELAAAPGDALGNVLKQFHL